MESKTTQTLYRCRHFLLLDMRRFVSQTVIIGFSFASIWLQLREIDSTLWLGYLAATAWALVLFGVFLSKHFIKSVRNLLLYCFGDSHKIGRAMRRYRRKKKRTDTMSIMVEEEGGEGTPLLDEDEDDEDEVELVLLSEEAAEIEQDKLINTVQWVKNTLKVALVWEVFTIATAELPVFMMTMLSLTITDDLGSPLTITFKLVASVFIVIDVFAVATLVIFVYLTWPRWQGLVYYRSAGRKQNYS